MSHWKEAGRAHGELFKDIRPVASMVEVTALVNPALLVEIEATTSCAGCRFLADFPETGQKQ
ncbi:hypothetical protein [Rufibacter sp. XAAS-G3-1]|uniref:hypothetical protein n=1 Tax=Rufibacter sp. XAAS-G3-1 TaxID=2729134 RepID=UPI00351A9EEB